MPDPFLMFFYMFGCMMIGYLGRDRLFGFWGYFFMSIIVTPLGGLLLLIPSEPDKKNNKKP